MQTGEAVSCLVVVQFCSLVEVRNAGRLTNRQFITRLVPPTAPRHFSEKGTARTVGCSLAIFPLRPSSKASATLGRALWSGSMNYLQRFFRWRTLFQYVSKGTIRNKEEGISIRICSGCYLLGSHYDWGEDEEKPGEITTDTNLFFRPPRVHRSPSSFHHREPLPTSPFLIHLNSSSFFYSFLLCYDINPSKLASGVKSRDKPVYGK